MAKQDRKITVQDVPHLLQSLACGDPETQQHTLRLLCPCRNRVYDAEIWTAIFCSYDSVSAPEPVRNQAKHAIETLLDRAHTSRQAQALVDTLTERGIYLQSINENRTMTKLPEKITSRDVPRLLETLACDDPHAQKDALRLLCPCRNRRYDKEVWVAIFQTYACAEGIEVRDQALHAIETLRLRARTDPRTQELLRWLSDQDVLMPGFEEAVPVWKPRGRGGLDGLYIPRFEHSPRSRANRRR